MNRFADAVPVESFAVLDMMKLAETAVNNKADLKTLQQHYQTVLKSAQTSEMIVAIVRPTEELIHQLRK